MRLKETYELRELHQDWESVYRFYPAQARLNAAIRTRILKAIRPRANALLLDAGCGVGEHTLAFAQTGLHCVGVDISEAILTIARTNCARAGLGDVVTFRCEALERLSFAADTFDLVHCRGVLMHIPQWEVALAELIRVLKPGGRLILFESNALALETWLVQVVRRFRKSKSRLIHSASGLESWSEKSGQPFLVRTARIGYLKSFLDRHATEVQKRWASEFWDIYRFPRVLRTMIILFNHWWFRLRLPSSLSVGNCLICHKSFQSRPSVGGPDEQRRAQ